MGMNLRSGCHKCKEKAFHFRGQESETILPFYRAHSDCMKEDSSNVVTLEDQYQWEDWMSDYIYTEEFN